MGDGVCVGVPVVLAVCVAVPDCDGVFDGVCEGEGVCVGEFVAVAELEGVTVGVAVLEGVAPACDNEEQAAVRFVDVGG